MNRHAFPITSGSRDLRQQRWASILLATMAFACLLSSPAFGDPYAQRIPALGSTVTKVAAGLQHSLFLKSDGTVWAVGNNGSGQLGDGTFVSRCTPVQVMVSPGVPLSGITHIVAGAIHSVARKSDGTVWVWGSNFYGQLKVTGGDRPWAAQAPGVGGAINVAAGQYHSLAHLSGGAYSAWGLNDYGQLGDNTTVDATQYGAGGRFSLAVRGNHEGRVRGWGRGLDGQLGDSTCSTTTAPVVMVYYDTTTFSFQPFTGAAYAFGGVNFSVVTTAGGKVWSTGQNGSGQLGTGVGSPSTCYLVQIPGLKQVTRAVAGNSSEHAVALKNDTTLQAWGRNDFGQLGDGTTTNRPSPGAVLQKDSFGTVTPATGFLDVAVNSLHSLGAKSDGTAWSWGDNTFCELGR